MRLSVTFIIFMLIFAAILFILISAAMILPPRLTQAHLLEMSGKTDKEQMIQTQKVMNVKEFGAKGDGVHDDTLPIQRALDMAAKSNRRLEVYFPVGTYKVNPEHPLTVYSNTRVFGEGNLSIIQADADHFGWDLFNLTGRDIIVQNVHLDGNHAVNRVLVIRSNSTRIQLEGVTIMNATQSIMKNSNYNDQIVSGIIIYGNTSEITINNSEISHLTAPNRSWITRGIYITTKWNTTEKVATDLTISNSSIHHIGSADDGDCIYYEDTNKERGVGHNTGSFITNNRMEACAKRAIKIYADGIVVDGNHIINSYLDNNQYLSSSKKDDKAPDMYAGISIYGDHNTITNNRIDGIGSYYAAIEVGATATLKGINIAHNTIKMGDKSNTKGTTAIRVGNIIDFSIRNNHIVNGHRAIWIWQNARAGIIEENNMHMPHGEGIITLKSRKYTHDELKISNNNYSK